ncbi:MAG TPA: hypothetical protein PLX56_04620 [bacterium]|nr:hypothetical protein [bacterium]
MCKSQGNSIQVCPFSMAIENSEEKFRESKITILDQYKNNKPVCEACYHCPKYDIDLCFRINEKDYEKALKLGFNRKNIVKE